MNEKEKIIYAEYLSVLDSLRKLREKGVLLYLEGEMIEPEQMARTLIRNLAEGERQCFSVDVRKI